MACKAKELRERKFDLQQDEANRREMEKKERARKEQQALKSPEDPRDAEVDGELDELELERLAFERAERAVRDEEARLDAMQFAEEEAAVSFRRSLLSTSLQMIYLILIITGFYSFIAGNFVSL